MLKKRQLLSHLLLFRCDLVNISCVNYLIRLNSALVANEGVMTYRVGNVRNLLCLRVSIFGRRVNQAFVKVFRVRVRLAVYFIFALILIAIVSAINLLKDKIK